MPRWEFVPVLWKEVKDLSRDRKTILATVLLPLFALPLLGLIAVTLTSQQVPVIAIVAEDEDTLSFAEDLARTIEQVADYNGYKVVTRVTGSTAEVLRDPDVDYIIVLPAGFGENVTHFDRVAYYKVVERLGSAGASLAKSICDVALGMLEEALTSERVEQLAGLAGFRVDPSVITDPLRELAPPTPVGPAGEEVPVHMKLRAEFARFLMFALFFVVSPAVIFISDSIIGERERKTIELALVSPVSPRNLLLGKLLASTLLGFAASVADVAGVVAYFYLISGGGPIKLDAGLIAVHSAAVALTVLVTASMLIPLVSRAESTRSAQTVSSAVTMSALAVYFSTLFVDIPKLPGFVRYPLYAVPYTHSVLAVYRYVTLEPSYAVLHLAVILAMALALNWASYRFFDPERIILHKDGAHERKSHQ